MKANFQKLIEDNLTIMMNESPDSIEQGRYRTELHKRTGISRVTLNKPEYRGFIDSVVMSLKTMPDSGGQNYINLKKMNEKISEKNSKLEKEIASLREALIILYTHIYSTSYDIKGVFEPIQDVFLPLTTCAFCGNQTSGIN